MAKAPNWTEEELKKLAEYYPKLGTNKEILQYFPGRSLVGIALKANRLGYKVINNIRKARTNSEYISLLENTNFIALEEYKGSTVPILHMCNICKHEWKARPQAVLRLGAQCPECDLKSRKLSLLVVDNTLKKENLERLSDYTGSLHTLTVKHILCGHIWDTKYSHIQQGSGCPVCNKGYGFYPTKLVEKDTTLYLLKIQTTNEVFLKVGVTLQPIRRRLSSLKSELGSSCISIEILAQRTGDSSKILQLENKILKQSKFLPHITKLDFAGKTELLSITNCIESIKTQMEINE